MRIVPTFDSRGFTEHADRLHADLRRAQVRALQETASKVMEGLRLTMEEDLDVPKEKTLQGLAASKARPGRAASVDVYVKPEVAEYLEMASTARRGPTWSSRPPTHPSTATTTSGGAS